MKKQRSSKMKKISRVFVVCLMMVMMHAMGSVSILRADDVHATLNPKIVKQVTVAEGVTYPSTVFQFNFTSYAFNNEADSSLPALPSITIEVGNATKTQVAGGDVYEASGAIAVDASTFTKAGVYTYELKEASGVNPNGSSLDTLAGMSYDNTTYRVHIYVKNVASGLEIANYTIEKVVGETTEKVDASEAGKGLVFANAYKTVAGSTGSDIIKDGDRFASFRLTKEVAGEYADKTRAFNFSVYFDAALTETTEKTYSYYVADKTTHTKIDGSEKTVTIDPTTGATVEVDLTHNQEVIFFDLPTGTSVHAIEKHVEDYTGSYSFTSDSSTLSGLTNLVGGQGDDSNNLYIGKNSSVNQTVFLGETINVADVTNTYKTVNFTGLVMDNLPFIICIIIGGAGLLMILGKRRKA
ncbi:hypothetical protein A4S06_05640 [Erysipelotrichaceae bacterium MTC7]|nr:hypothetical protein A4S06_05640 [Erysipelotrichaceae bacterium MTC7]